MNDKLECTICGIELDGDTANWQVQGHEDDPICPKCEEQIESSDDFYMTIQPEEIHHKSALCACRLVCEEHGRVKLYQCVMHDAAPDLLEALKALFEHCAMIHNRWGEGCNNREADAAIAAGRAAIAKADRR